jgi:hypothetical protein
MAEPGSTFCPSTEVADLSTSESATFFMKLQPAACSQQEVSVFACRYYLTITEKNSESIALYHGEEKRSM